VLYGADRTRKSKDHGSLHNSETKLLSCMKDLKLTQSEVEDRDVKILLFTIPKYPCSPPLLSLSSDLREFVTSDWLTISQPFFDTSASFIQQHPPVVQSLLGRHECFLTTRSIVRPTSLNSKRCLRGPTTHSRLEACTRSCLMFC
jgi:hypothetical protein